VRDELVDLLGKDTARMKFASQPPTVVLMAGLQGSGKTTTSGKLAHWFKNGGHRPLLVSVDVYRPAAREQLKIVAQTVKSRIYEGEVGEANTATVEQLVKEARREAIVSGCDVLIVDTAGRLHIDDQLMEEMQSLKRLLNPTSSTKSFRSPASSSPKWTATRVAERRCRFGKLPANPSSLSASAKSTMRWSPSIPIELFRAFWAWATFCR
jgi:signal recognition particle GTPase